MQKLDCFCHGGRVKSTVGSVLVRFGVVHNGEGLFCSGEWYIPQIVSFALDSSANLFLFVQNNAFVLVE